MKILIDAQLPRRLKAWLADALILSTAEREGRILMTKDADFVNEHILRGQPKKLLLVSTGNLSNVELEILFARLIGDLTKAFATNSFVEIGRSGLVIRG